MAARKKRRTSLSSAVPTTPEAASEVLLTLQRQHRITQRRVDRIAEILEAYQAEDPEEPPAASHRNVFQWLFDLMHMRRGP